MIKMKKYRKMEEVQAIRITANNFNELCETVDLGDGCLDNRNLIGDWLVVEEPGCQIYPHNDFLRNFIQIIINKGNVQKR